MWRSNFARRHAAMSRRSLPSLPPPAFPRLDLGIVCRPCGRARLCVVWGEAAGGYRSRRKTRLRAYGESAQGILGAILDGADSERAEPLRAWKSETSR